MPKVVVYSTAVCPYCSRARQLLDKKNVDYIDLRIDQEPEYRSEMESRSGRTSVPQIFIDDYHVGGFDDLSELEFDEKLDEMLGIS